MNDACLQHPGHCSGLSAPSVPHGGGSEGGELAAEATDTGVGGLCTLAQQPIIPSHLLALVVPLRLYEFFLLKAQPFP